MLRPLVGDLRQIASVRRLVLDDGAERGVPVLAVSSGGGLDLWLLPGRALDIGPLWFRGQSLAWQAPQGFASPSLSSPEVEGGRGFERLFSGFLMTCGLDRVRIPGDDGPLHGRLASTPARVLAAGERWDASPPVIEIVGEVVQFKLIGETLRLRRVVRVPVGGCEIQIEDTVSNEGPEPQPHDLLYHINFGYPSIASGTRIVTGERTVLGPIQMPDASAARRSVCMPAGASPFEVRTPQGDGSTLVTQLRQDSGSLPFMQIHSNLRPTRCLLALEPCTSDRQVDGHSAPNRPLAPGESRRYTVELAFSSQAPAATQRRS